MTANSKKEAWEIANRLFPTDYLEDPERSKRAGYPIYHSTADGVNAWISDLGCTLELNFPDGKTIRINIEEPATNAAVLLRYLQSQMDDYKKCEKRYGIGDRIVMKKLDAMIACKEMVESIIRQPVNLRQDGIVTVGL